MQGAFIVAANAELAERELAILVVANLENGIRYMRLITHGACYDYS